MTTPDAMLASQPAKVSLRELTESAALNGADVVELKRGETARRIVAWILLLVVGVLAFIGFFAWFTCPSLDDMRGLTDPSKGLEAYRDMRTLWFQQVRDAIQLLFIPLISLVGTVVGYVFGRRQS